MLPINIYPYLDITDLNLDSILKAIKALTEKLNNFVALNTIKYANPIQWNITTQYEMNTVVIDPVSGTAYLSVAPVPSGVSLTNTDYWTPIFTLNLLSANQNITLRDDANNIIATFESNEGDWLLWNYTLYKVTRHIDLSQAYVVGYNLERYTVELFIKDYISAINTIIGDLDDLTTTDKTTLVDAINELKANIGDLADLTTEDKDNIVNAINELKSAISGLDFPYVTPEQFGAVGDGVTDDTEAIQAALDSGAQIVYFKNTYLVTAGDTLPHNALEVPGNITICGKGIVKIAPNSYANYSIFHMYNKSNITFEGLTLIGEREGHVGESGEWGFGIIVSECKDVYIRDMDISKFWGDGIYIGYFTPDPTQYSTERVYVTNCHIHHNRRCNIAVISGEGCIVDGCELDHASGTAPQEGIDIEPDNASEIVNNFTLSNCYIHDNSGAGVGINATTGTNIKNITIHSNKIIETICIAGTIAGGFAPQRYLISGNILKCTSKVIEGTSGFSATVKDNYIDITSNTTPIKMNGINAAFINNIVEGDTIANDYIIFCGGSYSRIIGNSFFCGAGYGYIIGIGPSVTDCKICDNIMAAQTTAGSGFIELQSTTRINISNNTNSPSNQPSYFVVLTNVSSSTELASFNNAYFSTAFSTGGGGCKAAANVLNGTFTP